MVGDDQQMDLKQSAFDFVPLFKISTPMSPDTDTPPTQNQAQPESDQQKQQSANAQDSKKKRNGPKRRKVSHGGYSPNS